MPTPRAHAIAGAARVHLQQLQEELVKGEKFDPAASTRPFTLAVSDVAEMAFFPSVLGHMRTRAPKCPVSTVAVPDAQLAVGLDEHLAAADDLGDRFEPAGDADVHPVDDDLLRSGGDAHQ